MSIQTPRAAITVPCKDAVFTSCTAVSMRTAERNNLNLVSACMRNTQTTEKKIPKNDEIKLGFPKVPSNEPY